MSLNLYYKDLVFFHLATVSDYQFKFSSLIQQCKHLNS